jgi:hypothetical protein
MRAPLSCQAESLREGWRFGTIRDNAKKIHNCLVSWAKLPDDIREYGRNSIRAIPSILASTLKTFVVKSGKPYLKAENPKYPDLIPAQELMIQGVLKALILRAKE